MPQLGSRCCFWKKICWVISYYFVRPWVFVQQQKDDLQPVGSKPPTGLDLWLSSQAQTLFVWLCLRLWPSTRLYSCEYVLICVFLLSHLHGFQYLCQSEWVTCVHVLCDFKIFFKSLFIYKQHLFAPKIPACVHFRQAVLVMTAFSSCF